jgi:GT2 family glycosyltransferase
MQLSIVIVSYNTSDLLQACLESAYQSIKYDKISEVEVIVVDNNSSDGSVDLVRKRFKHVKLIENKENMGFAKANNQGMKIASGTYILILNSDTKMTKHAISKILLQMNSNKEIGVLGGKLLNKDDSIQPSVGYFPNIGKVFVWMHFIDDIPYISDLIKPYHVEDHTFYNAEHEVDWVTGACFCIRKEVFKKTNGFDEHIFMYGEEVEWCYRIKKEGYKVHYSPNPVIYHYKGQSGDGNYAGIVQEFKAISYFYKKHKPTTQNIILFFILKFGALLRLVLFGIILPNPKKAHLYAQILKMAG